MKASLLLLLILVSAIPVPQKSIKLVIDGKSLEERKDEVAAKVKHAVESAKSLVKQFVSPYVGFDQILDATGEIAKPSEELQPLEQGEYKAPILDSSDDFESHGDSSETVVSSKTLRNSRRPAALKSGVRDFAFQPYGQLI